MKFNLIQESKQLKFSVECDFNNLKSAIAKLEKMLQNEEISGDEIQRHCIQIEAYASAIGAGVKDNFEGFTWDDEDEAW